MSPEDQARSAASLSLTEVSCSKLKQQKLNFSFLYLKEGQLNVNKRERIFLYNLLKHTHLFQYCNFCLNTSHISNLLDFFFQLTMLNVLNQITCRHCR